MEDIMADLQNDESRVLVVSFPLLGVYALASTINYYLTHSVENVIGKGGTNSLREYLSATMLTPAEYELLETPERMELGRMMLKDDTTFLHYIPDICFPEFQFPQAKNATALLKKTAQLLGVPRKLLAADYQRQMHLRLTFDQLAAYGGIDPSIDTDTWDGRRWLQFIEATPHEPRRALIFTAMASMASKHTIGEMGLRLSSVIGQRLQDEPAQVQEEGGDDVTDIGAE